MKNIGILGSTGSIGTQALSVVRENPDIKVKALAAGKNIALLESQVREFKPDIVAVWEENSAKELALALRDTRCQVHWGMDGLLAVATWPKVDILVTAIVGMIGLLPTMAAIKEKKAIALANKETLVTAGHLIMPLAKEMRVPILPVDSEHCAIFQCLQGEQDNTISRVLLTASGGPFRTFSRESLEHVELEDALKHPNWSMGAKITIDSSTLVNKGLEVMEARWLFGVDFDRIQVVVQPQSIIHSMVEFEDGSIMAQLGTPDMKLPIQYALTYPRRCFLKGDRLDFETLQKITFEKPDTDRFPALSLAYQAGRAGGNMPTVFNSANEEAVALFLEKKIRYLDIAALIEAAMGAIPFQKAETIEDILAAEAQTRAFVKTLADTHTIRR